MLEIIQRYPRAFAVAVVGHIIMAATFAISFEFSTVAQPEQEVDVVQATAVDESQVLAELAELRRIEATRKKKEEDRVKRLEGKADKAERQRKREQDRIAKLEKQRKEEAKRKQQAEKERKQAQKKLKEDQKAAAEARRRLEEERKQSEAEARKAEAEAREAEEMARQMRKEAAHELELKQKAEEERMLREQLAAESKAVAAQSKKVQSTVNKFVGLIRQKVERSWNRPVTAKSGLVCTVYVRMMPTGDVLDVRIVKSSGDRVFDRSVENAVRKAAPLPLPADRAMFSHFRELKFEFKPKG